MGTWWLGDNDVDEDQANIILTPLGGNHLVVGPPGSGKTNILLLRANYLTRSNKRNIAIVVFTKTLRKFIETGGQQYLFPTDKIMTSSAWYREVLREYAVPVRTLSSFEEQQKHLIQSVRQLIGRRNLSNTYDAILLDEAQDYSDDEIDIFHTLAEELYAVGDSRQHIYKEGSSEPLQHLRDIVDSVHELRYHYRNGIQICKLADRIAKDSAQYSPLEPTSQYKEHEFPSRVTTFRGTVLQQANEIAQSLKTQLAAYPGDLLAVVCPKWDHLNKIHELLLRDNAIGSRISMIDSDEAAFTSAKPICLCTIHGVKGLEVRALHFACAEHIKNLGMHQRNLGFTAVTRAKTSLTIYHEGELKGWFETAVANLQDAPKNLGIKDLF